MNLHPYDGLERHFRHTDAEQRDGLAAVAHLLHLAESPNPTGLLYDLSFYSGGIGVLDHLAIALPANPMMWANVITELNAATPEEATADDAWVEDLMWLLTSGNGSDLPRIAAVQFINGNRRAFQAPCDLTSRIVFECGSNVNDWSALWGDDFLLNYLGYSQG
jgi:hypothetical protein